MKHKTDQLQAQTEHATSLNNLVELKTISNELETMRTFISDRVKQIQAKTEETIVRIQQQEPPEAAAQDIEKLKGAMEYMKIYLAICDWQFTERIEEHRRTCELHNELQNLDDHLKHVDARFGENLPAARAMAASFEQFEKTVTVRISEVYIKFVEFEESARVMGLRGFLEFCKLWDSEKS